MNDDQSNLLPSQQCEVQMIKTELLFIQQRLDALSARLEGIEERSQKPEARSQEVPPVIVAKTAPVVEPPQIPPMVVAAPVEPKESFEVRLGTFWLPRIGMALLLTGMVFLVTWSYHYMGAAGKVGLSYLCCALLGGLGWWLEKRAAMLARVLQAGALALTYFVTYAMHYVEAFRVIESPDVALTLLMVVVAGIVWIADRRQSAALAGMALFFGYYTSVMSGVATFTLAANAVLAVAALVFLARNRWVPITYGAVFATYLVYALWAWKFSNWRELEGLVFDKGYLSPEEFRLRAGFLSLYWGLFTLGGLFTARDTLRPAERTGLVTLNNAFLFVLFSMLMHHAHPGVQWLFQFCFAGAVLVTSAVAYQRYQPDRGLMDALFLQGVAVATLGLINRFTGVHLVASLAVESLFLLWLSRAMSMCWIAWIGRAAFGMAAVYAWSRLPHWDDPMICGAAFTAVVGLVCARVTKENKSATSPSALYYAGVSVVLAMIAVGQHFDWSVLPWVWPVLALLVTLTGVLLRTRETIWLGNLPLLLAHISYHLGRVNERDYTLNQSLLLIAVTLAVGLAFWARKRDDAALWPFSIAAVGVGLLVTLDFVPCPWQPAVFAAEGAVLVLSGMTVFVWLALAPLAVATFVLMGLKRGRMGPTVTAWCEVALSWLFLLLSARVLRLRSGTLALSESSQKLLRIVIVTLVTLMALFGLHKLAVPEYRTVAWAIAGFVLLALGFAVRERPYRIAGLIALGFSFVRVIFYDLAKVETLYRILSFLGLGAILLVLAFLYAKNRERLSKWL